VSRGARASSSAKRPAQTQGHLGDTHSIAARLQDPESRLFNLAIDSKLGACDLVKLRVRDVSHGNRVSARTTVMQQKTQRPVQFEITESTRDALTNWIAHAALRSENHLFPS